MPLSQYMNDIEYYLKDNYTNIDQFMKEFDKTQSAQDENNISIWSNFFRPEESARMDFKSITTTGANNLIASAVPLGAEGQTIKMPTYRQLTGEIAKLHSSITLTEKEFEKIEEAKLLSDAAKTVTDTIIDPVGIFRGQHINTMDYYVGQLMSEGKIVYSSKNTFGIQESIDFFATAATSLEATSIATLRANNSASTLWSASSSNIIDDLISADSTLEDNSLNGDRANTLIIADDVADYMLRNNYLSQLSTGLSNFVYNGSYTATQTNFIPYRQEILRQILQRYLPNLEYVFIPTKKISYLTSAGVETKNQKIFSAKKIAMCRTKDLGKMLWKQTMSSKLATQGEQVFTGNYGVTITIDKVQKAPPRLKYNMEAFCFPRFDEIGNLLIWQVVV